jgi:hypothetical protein
MANALAEARLPEDVLLTISEQLESKSDIASLCRAVRYLLPKSSPVLRPCADHPSL